jgi:hypothetical protein
MWFKNLDEAQKDVPPQPVQDIQPSQSEELPDWMQGIEDDRASETRFNIPIGDVPAVTSEVEAAQPSPAEELPDWMKGIEEDRVSETMFNIPAAEISAGTSEPEAVSAPLAEGLPDWMQGIEEDKTSETEFNLPTPDSTVETTEKEEAVSTEWMSAIDQESLTEPAASEQEPERAAAEELPSWLSELDEEKEQASTTSAMDADLPAWLREEAGEVLAEPTGIEPTRATDWHPIETTQPEPATPEPEPVMARQEFQAPPPEPEPILAQAETRPPQPEVPEVVNIIEERIAAVQEPEVPAQPPRERKLKGTGRLTMPLDPILGQARNELSGNNLSGAIDSYARLIKKGRLLDEVIFDLRDALYRFPVDVNVWQSLGDAYMRANRLQDALDAYTKAEELLR